MSDPQLYTALGRVEGKLDILVQAIPDHSKRIASLEKWRSFLAGVWFILAGAVAWAYKVFG